jgi:glutathione synthase/RimK-type ligase-like ATP-grasp enzyme
VSSSLAVVTGERAPELSEDGKALATALGERGLSVDPILWNHPGVDWGEYDAALFRSCWDYHADPDRFRDLLETLEATDILALNPLPAVRWNLHKFYLRDLLEAGVPALPTEFVPSGSGPDLATLLDRRGWDEAVVKPAIGTSSEGVWRTGPDAAGEDQDRFERALETGDVLLQEFAPEVRDGERSLVFFAGEFAYAKNVRPAEGEFRTHPNFGGTVALHDPPENVVEDASEALAAGASATGYEPTDMAYARVDGVVRDGQFRLMELELIEPYLGLEAAGAVETFADVVASGVRRRAPPLER